MSALSALRVPWGDDPLDAARRYLARGWQPIPVPCRSKAPRLKDWQQLRLGAAELPRYFAARARTEPPNIGVLLGAPSGGLVDIDLDAPVALQLADRFLPPTDAVFGRASKPRSHRLYRCDPPPATTRFRDPIDGATLVELRADGCQTIFPPSAHSAGEVVRWDAEGEPARLTADELRQAVHRLAAAALLARHWPAPGGRHDCALALAGALLRAGWDVAEVEGFIAAVADAAGDDETRDRVRTVASTAARLAADRPVTGLRRLAELLGARVVERVEEWLDLRAAQSTIDEDGAVPAGKRGEKLALRLLDLARTRLELFHSPDGIAYAGCGAETWRVPSRTLITWLSGLAYRELHTTLSADTAREVAAVLAAEALHDGPEQPVFVRVAPLPRLPSPGPADGADDADGRAGTCAGMGMVIDLADAERRVAVVTAAGWQVLPAARLGVRFVRNPGTLPLPVPSAGGDLLALWDFANVPTPARPLVLAWLVMALMPAGPYPHLMLWGDHGSAKSTTARVLAALLDPRTPALRAEPGNVRDLMIAARGAWLLAFDNLSAVPPWLSDALCRLSTGGGFATRELYTDADEVLFDAQRPLLSTGIVEYVTRPDLLDRTIAVELPPIPDEQRRAEAELWAAFERVRPRLFGALLDRLAGALRELPRTRLPRLPRMADFAVVAVAAEQGAGEAATFLAAYEGVRTEAHLVAVEASVIGPALLAILERQGGFVGTARDLLEALVSEAGESQSRRAGFPTSPRGLASELRRLAPALRALSWQITWVRRGKDRARTIEIARPEPDPTGGRKVPAQSSAPSAEPANRPPGGGNRPPTVRQEGPTVRQEGPTVRQNGRSEPAADGADEADGRVGTSGDDAEGMEGADGEDGAGPAGALAAGDRRCSRCGAIWRPASGGPACPICARGIITRCWPPRCW